MKKASGFTLIELLVAMSLLTMIILVGASASRFFGQHWDGRMGSFDAEMQSARNKILIQDILDSLIPYVAYNVEGKPIIYFEGNRNGFVAVASKSLYSGSNFAVVRFSVVQKADLSFDVIYEEWPMIDRVLTIIGYQLPFSKPLVLFHSVSDPRFEYFGWPLVDERPSEDRTPILPYWSAAYNGVEAKFAPLKARLKFVATNGPLEFNSSLTAAVPGLLDRYRANGSFAEKGRLGPVDDDSCNC